MDWEIVQIEWKHWPYKNTAFLLDSLILFLIFADSPVVQHTISYIGNLGYLGAVIDGFFFVSTFTLAPAAVLLFYFAKSLDPLAVAITAGFGAMIGDYVLLHFLKDRLFKELEPLLLPRKSPIKRLFHTPYFAWLIPIIGMLIILSPLPHEPGIGLLGASKLKDWQFIIMAFVLNTLGIFFVVIAARSF